MGSIRRRWFHERDFSGLLCQSLSFLVYSVYYPTPFTWPTSFIWHTITEKWWKTCQDPVKWYQAHTMMNDTFKIFPFLTAFGSQYRNDWETLLTNKHNKISSHTHSLCWLVPLPCKNIRSNGLSWNKPLRRMKRDDVRFSLSITTSSTSAAQILTQTQI